MKICRITGCGLLRGRAEVELSVGTVRQPRTCWPSSRTMRHSNDLLAGGALAAVVGQEDHADAVLARGRQLETQLGRTPRAGSASGIWMRMPAPSPVFVSQPQAPRCSRFQDLDGLADELVRLAALQVGDEADAASVVLVRRVVKPCLVGTLIVSLVLLAPDFSN